MGTRNPVVLVLETNRTNRGRERRGGRRGSSWEAFARGWSRGSGSQPLQGVAVWFNAFRLRHIFGEDLPTGAHLPEFAKVMRFVSHVQVRGIDGPSAQIGRASCRER